MGADSRLRPMTLTDLVARLREQLRGQVDAPALEAELLVAAAAMLPRERLLVDGSRAADPEAVARACSFAVRRLAGMPLALVTGAREFYGRRFVVRPGVLVPRPETEHLVEAALGAGIDGTLADLGTGSGALAVTLAAEQIALRRVVALDISIRALAIARENAMAHGVIDRVTLVQSDLFGAIAPGARFDAIVSNPPYVEPLDWAGLPANVMKFEPWFALTPGNESAAAFRGRLIEQSRARLKPAGWLGLEVGAGQAGVARDQFRAAGFRAVTIVNDLASIGRVVHGRRGA
ncbi:MAG: peptide chain release factor N(5)-glutamine methyltransferase [Planctomycetes bacterium]|nr:peptide chain release factor N(5)-glutamine methyltransferase [Planctomycetota bacterium]